MEDDNMSAHVKAAKKFKQLSSAACHTQTQVSEHISTKPSNLCGDCEESCKSPLDIAGESARSPREEDVVADKSGTCASSSEARAKCSKCDFLKFPYFNVAVVDADISKVVRIPLNVSPRAGAKAKTVLLFTNGRTTTLIDPLACHYFCGPSRATKEPRNCGHVSDKHKDVFDGIDESLPEMKNGEAYATRDGTVYLIGGKTKGKCQPSQCKIIRAISKYHVIFCDKRLSVKCRGTVSTITAFLLTTVLQKNGLYLSFDLNVLADDREW